ncbi:proliferation marker protein Ki-67 isoform X31 [Serinus canaria]|uniref:proliferation marker protein Ki-67 isoform X31 n=1 Tax=Serinus canaria TaxID=9135 RepID=UPI0021CC65D6|nr:proliferation marker protein Ki-67 isoform X31 [Serinus canaria]
MPRYGTIVVIKRNGTDGIVFPLTSTSCLFGRKTECDIRMRLPWVSNEHCKIEINENKEAVLTNLSSVNPTQLNGACLEQPVALKHGDVLTIIDRSFRFEYPLQSTPKRKRSRSPKDETLQVLHVQQVAEVELLQKQPPGAKSLDASDNAECEEKNANEKKQTPKKNLPEAFPVKFQTPKSSQRIHRVLKKQNEMSPFSKLYESVKNELKVEKALHRRSSSQQAAKGDPGSVVAEPSAAISSQSCLLDLGSLAKRSESGKMENIEKCIIVRREEENSPRFKRLSGAGRTPSRSFSRSPGAPISEEVSGDSSQSPKGLRTPGRSGGAVVTPRASKESRRSSLVLLEQCSIERFDCPVQGTVCSPKSCTASGGGPCVLSTPTPRRKSPRSLLGSPARESTGVNPGTPRTPRRGSLKLKSLPEIPAGAPREDPVCRIESTQVPLPEEKSLKQRRSSKQQTPGKAAQEVLKEIQDQANLDNSKVGHCETPASLSDSKSPRRSSRESKEFLDKSAHSEALAAEGMLASPAGQTPGRKRGRQRSSGVLAETALETNTAQEQHDPGRKASGTPAELAMDRCHQHQDLEDATKPRRPSGKRSPGSAAELRDTEPGSETKTFGLLHGEDSGKTKRISQKRKSGETLPQTLGKRKRVSFGGHLSPELFDKSLPPNSPLKRGALPARRSLPHGNSPRAVLKKAQGLKHLIDQEEKKSPKNSPAQQPPGASSPVSAPRTPAGSPAPLRKGRFSISQPPTPFPIAEEKDAGTEDMDPEGKSGAQGKTPKSSPAAQDAKALVTGTPARSARGAQLRLKGSAMRSRGGAVAVISAKRRSGASSANLLVAKSWAEVVKLGVARPQPKTAKKTVRKGRALKRLNHPPKTPEKKIKGHFSTGHAESPATIVVGRAYSTRVRSAGHVPKVVKNPKLKLNMDMDESYTGVSEMFQTPKNQGGRTFPLAAAQDADVTPPWAAGDISDLHTPEESGEMIVSPLNNSDASEQKQESPGIFHLLKEESSPSMFDEIATKTPGKRKAVHRDPVDSLAVTPEKPAPLVKSGSKRRTPKQKLEPVEVMSSKRKILRTPEQRSEPGEVLSGIKRLMKTPRQKPEPVEVLSGIKQLLKTPRQKPEPVEVLSGIKQLLKTPDQKLEPVEVLSGIKHLRTPKQKLEAVEALSDLKHLMRTPKQKLEPVEALSGIKHLMRTPKQKLEPVEALSGIKHLMRTPKQKLEPVEALSDIKHLMRTPRRKPEPVEDLSGIKQLLRTPQQELEPVTDEIALKRLLETPVESREAVKAVPGVTSAKKSPKLKSQPVEDMVGISRIFQTPKEKVEPVENMFGISRLMKSPKEKYQPVEDFVGLQRLMAEPRQKSSDSEVDYAGVTEMFGTPEDMKVRSVNVMDSQGEIAPPGSNSSHKHEEKGGVSQGEDSQQKDSAGEEQPTQRPRRGRRAVPPAAAKPSENGVSLKELQSPDTQEEMGVITAENKGRGRRPKRCIQEVAPKCPDQQGLDIVSSVEPPGAAQRPGRGKRKELKELKHPNENLESCVEDSSVLQKAPANTKQSLQDCDTNETEDDPGTKTGPGNTESEICQLQTGLDNPDSKAADSGVEDSEEVPLSPRRHRGVENTEPVIPPRRGRRARNDQGKAASPGDLHGTTRRLRKDPSPKVSQRQEQACDKAPEAVTAQESENGTKLELKATERRVRSLRSTRNRKDSAEIKADTHGVALENTQNIQKTEETSTETDAETQSHVKNKMKGSQGYETENAQENTTEAARRLKAESPSAETNKMPVSAQNMEANRARNRRGKKDFLEQKAEELTENVNSLKPVTPKFKSEAEVDESSLQDSVGSLGVSAAQGREEQPSPGAPSVPAADSASPAQGTQRRTRNEQGILKTEQTEILQSNPAQRNAVVTRRGRGKKVNFQFEESSSKAIEGKSLPEGDEGMTNKDNQHESSENPPSQGRRGRRKQLDSIPQKASPASMEKQTLSADPRKDEAVVQEPGSALEAAPSLAEDNPPRRGRSREVAAAPQTRSSSVRTRRGLLEGDAKQVAQRGEENPALDNKTLQAKVSAPARDRRKKMDPAAEATSSTPLQEKCGLPETKDEGTQEEQSVPLEAVSCAKEKPAGRGRRKETALASHTTNSISLRGKRRSPAGDGEEAHKEEQNVPLETCDPPGKENQLRRGRRKETAPLVEAKSSIQGNQVLTKQRGRKNNNREAKQNLDNSSQENTELVKGSSGQATTSLALSPTSLQGLPEDDKDRIPEEKGKLLDVAPPAKENPSGVGRKKTASSTSEETISTSLRGKPNLSRGRGQKRILQESEDASPENNPCQGRTRQLRNNRRKVEVSLEAAPATSPHESSDLPGNGSTLGTRDWSGASTASEENLSGKGQEGDPAPQAAPTARRRKGQLPAEDVPPKKLKSGNDENGSLQRGRRNKTKLGAEDARASQTTGGMERRTRSSTRTRK